jgi:hypothetical protein
MSEPRYYVMVDGQKLGPFDKRTITGMRIKKILTNEHKVHQENGPITTVFQLLGGNLSSSRFQVSSPLSSGVVFPRFAVRFLIPPTDVYSDEHFVGAGELRVQPDVLRIAGQVQAGVFGKPRDHRIKVPREHVCVTKHTGRLVLLEAQSVPGRPHKSVFSLEFETEVLSKAFCDFMAEPGMSPSKLMPDVEI